MERILSLDLPVPHFAMGISAGPSVLPLPARRVQECARAGSTLRATLSYLPRSVERPFNYTFDPPVGTVRENYVREERVVAISDARADATRRTVDREGFSLWDAPTAMRDFTDHEQIVRGYYREAAEIACAATGAARAYVFDHLVRRLPLGSSPLDFGRPPGAGPASANGQVHNDYTESSGRRRLALVLGKQIDHGLSRYGILNVWRTTREPVLDAPLAVCDARTVAAQDLVAAELRHPKRTGEIYLALHSPHHQWFYFPAMQRSEVLVFKQYDSQVSGVARFTLHAAFRHPATPVGTPPRESIEARCLVIYE